VGAPFFVSWLRLRWQRLEVRQCQRGASGAPGASRLRARLAGCGSWRDVGRGILASVARAAAALRRPMVRSARRALAILPRLECGIYGSCARGGDVGDACTNHGVIS
jgi:hypothetical protein